MVSDSDRLGVEVVVENCHIVFQSRLTGAWFYFVCFDRFKNKHNDVSELKIQRQ